MPTAIKNCALQRVAGGKEQGLVQDIWQVLGVGGGLPVLHTGCVLYSRMMMFTLSYGTEMTVYRMIVGG